MLIDQSTACRDDIFLKKLENYDVGKLAADIEQMEEFFRQISIKLASSHAADPLAVPELLCGFEMGIVMHKSALAILKKDTVLARLAADKIRLLEERLSYLWHKRNKPSEYFRIKDAVLKLADKLDSLEN